MLRDKHLKWNVNPVLQRLKNLVKRKKEEEINTSNKKINKLAEHDVTIKTENSF